MRAVICARLSEDHERAESVPTQISNSTKHAERMGWEVVRVFKDEGQSGYTGEHRPGFEEMIKFLGSGQVDVLITRHHDRLTRNPDDFARLMQVCGKAKIKINLYTGGELDRGRSATRSSATIWARAGTEVSHHRRGDRASRGGADRGGSRPSADIPRCDARAGRCS